MKIKFQALKAVVQKWVDEHEKGAKCEGEERVELKREYNAKRVELGLDPHDDVVKKHSKTQLDHNVSVQLKKCRGVVYFPEHTNLGKRKVAKGEENSECGKRKKESNAIYNPIYNAKRMEANKKARNEYLASKIPDLYREKMTDDQLKDEVEKICLEKRTELNGYSLEETVQMCAETFSFYVGFTGQELEKECFRFLTFRGAALRIIDGNYVHKKGRTYIPIYTTPDEKALNQALREELGLKAFVVFHSPLMENAIRVEELLQRRFQHLDLGVRMWHHPAKGAKMSTEEGDYKVFITFSFKLLEAAANGRIKLNDKQRITYK